MDNTIINEDLDPRRMAMYYFWQGLRIAKIADLLNVNEDTLRTWKHRDKWEDYNALDRVLMTTSARYCFVAMKPNKDRRDLEEMDALSRQMERQTRIGKYQETGKAADLNPKLERPHKSNRKKPAKNAYSDAQYEKLKQVFFSNLFDYQRIWYEAGFNTDYRIRNILKSRQIGATWFFAREALLDAMETGRNQLFLSASKNQALVFKAYMIAFAQEADIELKGDAIVLPNNAQLEFLGTNSSTAQGRGGNLYFDEYFWVPSFKKLRSLAGGMATQTRFRQTYFSTPSTVTHEAYPFWTGKTFNKGRPKEQQIDLDVSPAALKNMISCGDGQQRQIVTIHNAIERGLNLSSVEQLQRENSPDEFRNLFLCEFIDDSTSVFPFEQLRMAMVDATLEWEDFNPLLVRPFSYKRVWVGYDPNGGGEGVDLAGLVVIAPPDIDGKPFRVLERCRFQGSDYAEQARAIKQITERYNVEHIAIDVTGIGDAVAQLVVKFFPAVRRITYSVEVKNNMVLKMLDVLRHGRFIFDAGHNDIAQSFMAIRRVMTPSGRQVTYKAGRSAAVGHSDIAWAIMNVIYREPLSGQQQSSMIIEVF